jgi:hypothetical protein
MLGAETIPAACPTIPNRYESSLSSAELGRSERDPGCAALDTVTKSGIRAVAPCAIGGRFGQPTTTSGSEVLTSRLS